MLPLLQRLARALLPPAIRKPLADRFYIGLDRWRVLSGRCRGAVGRCRDAAGRMRARMTPHPRSGGRRLPTGALAVALARSATGELRRAVWRGRHAVQHQLRRLSHRLMPLVWARPPHSVPVQMARPVVLAGLRVADIVQHRRFASLLDHACPAGAPHGGDGRPQVCLLIGTLGPGGAERQAANTAIGLAEGGNLDLTVIATHQEQEWQRFFTGPISGAGVPVCALERHDPLAALAACGHPDGARLAETIRTRLPPPLHDVAAYAREFLLRRPHVAHLWLDDVNVRAGLAAVLAGVPTIVLGTRSINPSNFALFQPYMRGAYLALSRLPHVRLLNNSDTGARDYERWLGLRPGHVSVVRNGFDFDHLLPPDAAAARTTARARLGLPSEALVLGGIMRFSEEKRPLLWLDTAELVLRRHPQVELVLIGDGVLRHEVHARAATGGLAGRVRLPGHDARAYEAICAMDVLFLSSRHEGLPNVLIEAQALGVPVVTMRAGGAHETLTDGETGWVVPGPQAEDAARVLADALADPAALRRAGALGRKQARDRFGVRRMLDETARMYGLVPRRTAPNAAVDESPGGASGDR